jgi:signal transduction histidine kinase
MAPVIVNEVQNSGEEKAVRLRGLGARAYASYPLRIGPRLFGTFSFVSLFRDRFSPDDLAMIGTLCDLVSATTDRKRLLAEASAARETAEKANAAKDDFLAALSHELRTPLNPVLLLSTAAASDPHVPAELRTYFEIIARNALLEARLIDDLLDSTRIARGKLVLEKSPHFVNEIVSDAIANVHSEFEGKHLAMKIDLDPSNPIVDGDAVRLQQIVWNVLKNALKFTPDDGSVSIKTSAVNGRETVRIEISDTGEGMTPAELKRIFEAFEQGDHAGRRSSKKFGGLGLGLAIARSLVELHSGSIQAASDGIGLGSRFVIELPLHTTATDVRRGSAPEMGEGDTTSVATRCEGLRILLVEDHTPTRIALAHLLTKRKYVVSTAANLADARELGSAQVFDLLITDIGLPDGSGYDLMSELSQLKKLKGIAMTGYGMEEDLQRSVEAGFSAHLTKPVKMQLLEKAIGDAVAR